MIPAGKIIKPFGISNYESLLMCSQLETALLRPFHES